MFNWLRKLWADSEPVEFLSSFPLQQSVERLKAATRYPLLSMFSQQRAAGTVQASHVSLHRVIPMVGNSFKPYFRGRFLEQDGKVILVGRFSIHWAVKLFMTLWLCGVFAFCVGFLAAPSGQRSGALTPLGMFAFGIALVAVGRWFARNDPTWLSDVIQNALTVPPPRLGAAAATAPQQPSAVPTVVAVFLTVMGLIACAQALSGIESFQAGTAGADITYFQDPPARYTIAAWGLVTLLLAYGIYRRLLIAWRAFLVFIAVSWAYAAIDMVQHAHDVPPAIAIFFVVGSSVVALVWSLWWYGQKSAFHE